MATTEVPNGIILYWYTFSPYGRKISWYLQLRGMAHADCMQPALLPRPDLEALGISYRRIPLLSIGKDFYLDTRLILKKLECLYPEGRLGAPDSSAEHRAIERLLARWTTDAGIFSRAAALIPAELPLMSDPAFARDREDLVGGKKGSWSAERMAKARPESLVYIRDAFELLETTLLSDGRDWIFKTKGPSLGDIEAIWPFAWLVDLKTALPTDIISANQYPKVFSWIARFRQAVKDGRSKAPPAASIKGSDLVPFVAEASFREAAGEFDGHDPLGLQPGDEVEIFPNDTGSAHKDRGKLVTLTPSEVVISKKTKDGGHEIRLHAPRWGFRVSKATGEKL